MIKSIRGIIIITLAGTGVYFYWNHHKNSKSPFYLDYAASNSINKHALNKFIAASQLDGNSSGLNFHAQTLKQLENESAVIIAQKLQAKQDQIVFTQSSTMANNIVILGVANKYPKCHFITSKIEHKSVLNIFHHLEEKGNRVTYLDVDANGFVDLNELQSQIKPDTKLISIQMVNSEIGTIQNLKAIGEIAKKNSILFHSDAAQGFCKHPIDVEKCHLDFLTLSGYKIGSPKGISAFYIKDKKSLDPILFGSNSPLNPGSQPTPLIISLGEAVRHFQRDDTKLWDLSRSFVKELRLIEGVFINPSSDKLPPDFANDFGILSISIRGVILLDLIAKLQNYSFSGGCSCLGSDKSNVIAAIDKDKKLPTCTIRVSFTDKVPKEKLIQFAKDLKITIETLRKEKPYIGEGCFH